MFLLAGSRVTYRYLHYARTIQRVKIADASPTLVLGRAAALVMAPCRPMAAVMPNRHAAAVQPFFISHLPRTLKPVTYLISGLYANFGGSANMAIATKKARRPEASSLMI